MIMKMYFDEQQSKKDFSLNVATLESMIVQYNETFINNYLLEILVNNDSESILIDRGLALDKKNLTQAMAKDKGSSINKAFAKYFINYTNNNLTSSDSAYLNISIKAHKHDDKYNLMKSKLKIIKNKANNLFNTLGCNIEESDLQVLLDEFDKREKFHGNFLKHVLKTIDKFDVKRKLSKNNINLEEYKKFKNELYSMKLLNEIENSNEGDVINDLVINYIKKNIDDTTMGSYCSNN